MKIILGSNSKRRKELLDMIGIKYEIVVSDEEEVIDSNLSNLENCQSISLQKALNVKKKTSGDRIIITCDTIVQKNNKLYGKPKDRLDAINMLKMFLPIPSEDIPKDSLLREFIGGSCFK